ncbi:S8 family serine peptidase [Flavihumibacter sp. ZG627]|uniref:S8 family serine peptidase n=1 Tax=Flavihumibacter sp. ZG627 TaxID=1463156 RepID=UPI0006936518|nr:S8 family serine peptidase [Flavihumibacter sp. ZG627]
MRIAPVIFRGLIFCTILVLALNARTQVTESSPIRLKSSLPAKSLVLRPIDPLDPTLHASIAGGKIWAIIQFKELPGTSQQTELRRQGIELYDYIPENSFLAGIRGSFSASDLSTKGIQALVPMNRSLKSGIYGLDANNRSIVSAAPSRNYHLKLIPGHDSTAGRKLLENSLSTFGADAEILKFLTPDIVECTLTGRVLNHLLDQSFLLYVMEAPALGILNSEATDIHQTDQLHTGFEGMPALSGKGVVMGIGDNGRIYHIDHRYNEEGQSYNGAFHATHVAGAMAGAGILDPSMKGNAWESTLIIDYFNTIIDRSPEYYKKGMVITNNSYGAGSQCLPYSGLYTGYCVQGDQQLLDLPNLAHVFAAGNNGGLKCGDFPAGFRSIDNAFQAAKNVITVGATNKDANLFRWSKGPTLDGRLKPEVIAIGDGTRSTANNNTYAIDYGTSMSAPQVTGVLGLLYERYRQLNGNVDPPGDLMKAIVCNTATDIGNKGVDFTNGFGFLNARKAIEVVNAKTYLTGSVDNGGETRFEINLPEQVKDLKIMLYWHDKPSSLYTFKNLVNDLDISVVSPTGAVLDPMILDTSAAGVNAPAIAGKDHSNNIEQVVVENAVPGAYTILVKGFKVPAGPQSFRIVYNWEKTALRLLQPAGGEKWKPAQQKGIIWSAGNTPGSSIATSFSADGGLSWTDINIRSAHPNRKDWTVPSISTSNARIRIRNNISGEEIISNAFTILPDYNFSLTSTCASTISARWKPAPGIDSVQVLQYEDGAYKVVATTTDTFFVITGLRSGPNYWITLQPLLNGFPGERSPAKLIKTPATLCPPSGAAGDLAITTVLNPSIQRFATSTDRNGIDTVIIQLRNMGNSSIADTVFLSVYQDKNLLGSDTLIRNLTPGEAFLWKSAIILKAEPGEEKQLEFNIRSFNDPEPSNNTLANLWRYLPNEPVTLPLSLDFGGLKDSTYLKPGIIGIIGAPQTDYTTPSAIIKLHSNSTGIPFTASSKVHNQEMVLTSTFNMAAFQLADDIRLSLDIPEPVNLKLELAVRGSDTSAWLILPQTDPVTYVNSLDHINITRVLGKGSQQFSSSFQLRLKITKTNYDDSLPLLRSIRLFKANADMALIDLYYIKNKVTDGDNLRFRVSALNLRSVVTGGFTIGLISPDGKRQTISFNSIAANDTAHAEFTVPVKDWPSAVSGVYAFVTAMGDINQQDDTLFAPLAYAKLMNQFPYLQGFENDKQGWGSTFIYDLAENLQETVKPFKAANGNGFWGTRRLENSSGVHFVVASGYLVSPLFDLRQLRAPHLSMSVNKQLCDGKDSVLLEFSADTGRTWQRYIAPVQQSTNWYTEQQQAWKDCGNDYWQVVSMALPKGWATLQFRVLSLERSDLSTATPIVPGGLLLDEVHIFDLEYPVDAGLTHFSFEGRSKTQQWTPVIRNGALLSAAKSSEGEQPFRFNYYSAGEENLFQGNPVLKQRWVFSGSNNTTPGKIRLFLTDDAVRQWLAENPCDTCAIKRSAYDLAVFRYTGPPSTLNEKTSDNLPGFESVWMADQFELIPYEKGYYAEIPSGVYGEFYFGINNTLSTVVLQATERQEPTSALLQWDATANPGILRFEVERANGTGSSSGFQTITIIQTQPNGNYTFTDAGVISPGSYQYRLKIIYENGQVRYSNISSVNFGEGMRLRVYPNPSPVAEMLLLVENLAGKTLQMALVDVTGRVIWRRKVDIAASVQVIPLYQAGPQLAPGIYYLRAQNGKEIKTMRLVISGN